MKEMLEGILKTRPRMKNHIFKYIENIQMW